MNIFYKRPLSLILCISLGSFVFFAFYEHLVIRIALFSILASALSVSFITPIKRKINHLLLRVAAICGIIALLLSFLYFDLWFYADQRYDGTSTVHATVENIKEGSYTTALYVETDNINETAFSEYNLIVYVENGRYSELKVGAEVIIKGEIDGFTSDKNFDAKGYYSAKGISGIINDVVSLEISGYGKVPITNRLTDLRKDICNRLIKLSDDDTGGLLGALLLGEK